MMRQLLKQIFLTLFLCLTLTAFAQAAALINERFPFQITLPPSECISEDVELTGEGHILVLSHKAKKYITFKIEGSGVGLSSGNPYEWIDTMRRIIIDPEGPALKTIGSRRLILLSPGSADNEFFNSKSRRKVDAEGNVVVDFQKIKTRCREKAWY